MWKWLLNAGQIEVLKFNQHVVHTLILTLFNIILIFFHFYLMAKPYKPQYAGVENTIFHANTLDKTNVRPDEPWNFRSEIQNTGLRCRNQPSNSSTRKNYRVGYHMWNLGWHGIGEIVCLLYLSYHIHRFRFDSRATASVGLYHTMTLSSNPWYNNQDNTKTKSQWIRKTNLTNKE